MEQERKAKVTVLMSTYNGQRYIKGQIMSILGQTGVDIKLCIRDDGSSDGTLSVIEGIKRENGSLTVESGLNCGAGESFFKLIWGCDLDSDYYAFCDQDDIWLKDKLIRAIKILNSRSRNEVRMYASPTILVDERLNVIGCNSVTWNSIGHSFGNALIENNCSGCTILFPKSTLSVVRSYKKPEHMYMHDWFFYLFVSAFGEVVMDHSSYILYRQHDKNALGGYRSSSNIFARRVKNMKYLSVYLRNQLREFGELYPVDSAQKEMIENVVGDTFVQRIKMLFNRKIKRTKWNETIYYKIYLLVSK